MTWAGIDVGGSVKGFDVALVDERRLCCLERRLAVDDVVQLLGQYEPRVVAVDSPRTAAAVGERSRVGERNLVAAHVCGIRFTPDSETLQLGSPYYEWIRLGLALYARLEARWRVIECFPTASWSRWGGPRGAATRRRWSQRVLETQELEGMPRRLNQDARDAVGAALTAREHDRGQTQSFGEIVVPLA